MNPLIFTIGQKVRSLRNERGMTLGDLAAKINVSLSLISQLERGGVNCSISLLKSIADSLGVPLATLIREEEHSVEVSSPLMTENERKILTTEGGVRFSLLSRHLDIGCEFEITEWPPGSSTGRQKYKHEGVECGVLLEGHLEVELEDSIYHLKPGDSITFRSDVPHRVNNKMKTLAKAVWINSKPWIFSTK
jgi:transcriptional regulator with XRE-family HTH domain